MDRRQWGNGAPPGDLQESLAELRRLLGKFGGGRVGLLALAVLVLLWLASGIYVVGPGERGVVLSFGKAWAQTEPGLRYRFPWPLQQHFVVDTAQVRRVEIGFRTGRGGTQPVPEESLMLTGDENIVDVQLFVQYLVQDPVRFLFRAREPEEVLRTSAEVALRGVVGQNTIDYTMTDGRVEVQEKVKAYLQGLLDAYQTGLLVTEARLLVVDPPQDVREAFHDVVRAWEDRERLIKEAEGYGEDVVPKARGEAAQMLQQAEAYKAQRVIRAQGDAARFLTVLAEYQKAKAVTRDRLYLERVEKVLAGTQKFILEADGRSVLPFLPLKD
jgi:membrane protease subunit HflK